MSRFEVELKTVYIENEETKKSEKFTIEVLKMDELVNFTPLIEQIPSWQNKVFELYDPMKNSYLPLEQFCDEKFLVFRSFLFLDVVMIRYSEDQAKAYIDVGSEDKK